MNILLIGNMSTGKTSIAESLIKKGFIGEKQFYSIDSLRREYSDGTMAGEFYAWANMLEAVQHPHPTGNGIYEFSGTGKNAWFFRECIKYSKENHDVDWIVVYCLADRNVLMGRIKDKTYDVPLPYDLDPIKGVDYISAELQKKYGSRYWNAREITVRTDQNSPEEIADEILKSINA